MVIKYDFDSVPADVAVVTDLVLGGGVSEAAGGRLAFNGASPAAEDGQFSLKFQNAVDLVVIVNFDTFSAQNPSGDDLEYSPAWFDENETFTLHRNQAAPYPSDMIVAGASVSEFAPQPLRIPFSAWGGGADKSLYFRPSRYGAGPAGSLLPMPGTYVARIQFEVEGDGGGGGGTGTSYNCECDDAQPTVTLKQMRERLARRLGFAVQVGMGTLPPGMPELLDDFTRSAHELLYRQYSAMRMRRMFTWNLEAGVRFYDLEDNADDCPRVLDPGKLEWVGISQGDSSWRPLICGISPTLYCSAGTGIPSHYEIRQCIEVWPAPPDDTWQLRIRGDFGPSPLELDDDVLTVDPEAVFLQALANAKAHYGQGDAANYASQATAYIRSRVAESHQTRRYIPGTCTYPPAVRPLLKED